MPLFADKEEEAVEGGDDVGIKLLVFEGKGMSDVYFVLAF